MGPPSVRGAIVGCLDPPTHAPPLTFRWPVSLPCHLTSSVHTFFQPVLNRRSFDKSGASLGI